MATGTRHDIDLPLQRARTRAQLLNVARPIPASELVRDGVNRFATGVEWSTWPEIDATLQPAECDTVYNKTATEFSADLPTQPAFVVWQRLSTSMICGTSSRAGAFLRASFTDFLSPIFASELETAAGSEGLGLVGDATYPPTIVASTAVSLAVALARLEDYLAQDSGYPGMRGVIHLTPGLLTLAVAEGLVEPEGDHFVTPTGHVVIADAGHTGEATPYGGTAVSTGEVWIYATGDIWWASSAIKGVMEIEDPDGGSFYMPHNEDRPLAEMYGLIVFDPNILAAAKVTTDSGGDASASNQATMIDLLDPTLVIEAFTADETIAAANYYHGITVRNADAGASRVTIHHGANSSAPVIDYIDLAIGETLPLRMLTRRLPTPDGIHIEVVSGTVTGSLVYEA